MKKSLLIASLSFFAFVANGAGKYTPSTMQFLDDLKSQNERLLSPSSLLKSVHGVKCVDMFIEVNDDAIISQLESMGVAVGVQMNGVITASVPVEQIENIAALDEVKCLSVATQYRLLNDKARESTGISMVHAGTDLPHAYNGEGVIYGTFDTGVDFNHVAFKNEDNTSRILYAYMPTVNGGTKVTGNVYDSRGNVVAGGTFPGSEYDSSQISSLTTDDSYETHGTHTMSIGAGGYMGNSYYGMAPKADIIACASPSLSDVNIINTISYVFSKADKLNEPAVMNLSLGGNTGIHDGSGYFERLADGLTGPGKIIVLSAGNEGSDYLHVGKKITSDTDTMKFTIANSKGNFNTFKTSDYCLLDVWSKGNTDYTLNIIVYDKSKKKIVYTSRDLKGSGSFLKLTQSTADFSTYFSGNISLYAYKNNNRYNISGTISGTTKNANYRLGVMIKSKEGTEIDAYGNYISFGQESITGFTKGDNNKSINTMATGQNTISVGAYSSRNNGPSITGMSNDYSDYFTVGDLADFSSFGPDDNGNIKPEVCAPGAYVISALSSYCSDYSVTGAYREDLALEETVNGKSQRYGLMYGTSMSSPCCAGIIATWLQANPTLTPDQVKEIISKTSTVDSYVTSGGESKWGAGKINALAGLKEAMVMSSVNGAIKDINTPLLVYPNPSNGEFEVTVPNEVGNITLNVYDMKGALVAAQDYSLASGNTVNVNLSSELSTGMYILQVKGNNTLYTSRLVIK